MKMKGLQFNPTSIMTSWIKIQLRPLANREIHSLPRRHSFGSSRNLSSPWGGVRDQPKECLRGRLGNTPWERVLCSKIFHLFETQCSPYTGATKLPHLFQDFQGIRRTKSASVYHLLRFLDSHFADNCFLDFLLSIRIP